jgi:glycosyltransferase involved in cell wall biosynthesis
VRLVILNQFFYPDHSATSQLMTELAESLVQAGLDVTAVAGRGLYSGGGRLADQEQHDGVRIERAWSTRFGKKCLAARLSDYLSFYIGATWKLFTIPRHDIVMALTTPPLIGVVALIVGRIRGMRVVALIQDVYPDVAVALGALKPGSLITQVFEWLSKFTLRGADRIVVLSECMRHRIAERAGLDAAARIDVIHNWADGKHITPVAAASNPFAIEHGLDGKFVVLFSGNIGQVNDFDTVLSAALLLRDRPRIRFLFIGDGARAARIKSFAESNRLANIRLLPYQPKEITRYSIAAGDAALVTLAEGLAGLSVPSKTYSILAAGRPVLFVGDTSSEVARILSDNECGAVFKSGDAAGLARLIAHWSEDRRQPDLFGQRARVIFERRFDRPLAVNAYLETLGRCMAGGPRPLLKRVITQQQE